MSVRRKSNWYIYFIAFGIALAFAIVAILMFKWYLFPERSTPVGLDKSGELTSDFKPANEQNFSLLTMLSDGASDNPSLYVLVEYLAVESRMTFIPLPNGISLTNEGRTLPNIYAAQGGEAVVKAVESELGITCDGYVKLNRSKFITLLSSFGNVEYDVPKTLLVTDGVMVETINAGTQRLAAESVFRLAMFAEYSDGESYRFNCIGTMFSELINQNYRKIDSSLLDSYFGQLIDGTENDLTDQKYKDRKAALINTVVYGVSPAEYYVPYGEYAEDGSFNIAENSITTIRQKAGLQ